MRMLLWIACCLGIVPSAEAAQLYVGRASISITPDRPVALQGQRHIRIAHEVETPCLATALVLETRDGEKLVEQATFVSCDLCFIPDDLRDDVRRRVAEAAERLAGKVDVDKIIVSATHTHTAPVLRDGTYDLPKEGIMQPAEYHDFCADRIATVVAKAFGNRRPAKAGWGLGHAVVARNRIALYTDGKAQMYGSVAKPDFARFEGYEDHGVEVLFFWDDADQLLATAVNVACPAQEVEGRTKVNADFWHPVRELLHERFGDDLAVLAWTGAGGDQSPHVQLRKAAEQRMLRLKNTDSLAEIARRIVYAWDEAYAGAQHEKFAEPALVHQVRTIDLPMRQVTQEQMLAAKTKAAAYADDPKEQWNRNWHQRVVDRYEAQRPGDVQPTELHVVRLGDVAVATNPFELYTDYGVLMKAQSPALQTFVIQLTGAGKYLPAERSIPGGAYGSILQSGLIGPEGGAALVKETLKTIGQLWATGK